MSSEWPGAGSEREPFWPDEAPRMDEEEIRNWILAHEAGRLYTSYDLPSFDQQSTPAGRRQYTEELYAAWPIWLLAVQAHGNPPETYLPSVGLFWSWLDQRKTAMQVPGSPGVVSVFADMPTVMHADDLRKIHEATKESP